MYSASSGLPITHKGVINWEPGEGELIKMEDSANLPTLGSIRPKNYKYLIELQHYLRSISLLLHQPFMSLFNYYVTITNINVCHSTGPTSEGIICSPF